MNTNNDLFYYRIIQFVGTDATVVTKMFSILIRKDKEMTFLLIFQNRICASGNGMRTFPFNLGV